MDNPKPEPYSEYKPFGLSWLGHIPAHWDEKPGFAIFSEKHEANTGMKERRVLSLSYGRIVVKPEEKLRGLIPESFETYQVVSPGEIIIRSTDLQNDLNSLRVGLVRDRGIITSAYLCLKGRGSLTTEYAYLLLHSYDLRKFLYGLGSGLRQNLDFSDFKRLAFPVPPLSEQEVIVGYVNALNRRVERYVRTKRKHILLLNEQRVAAIAKAFAGALDDDVSLKPSGITFFPEVPRHWELLQVRRLVSLVTSGSRGWASYYSESGDIFLQSGNLGRSMQLNLAHIQHVRPPLGSEGLRTKVQRNDILVCITGALTGNVALVDTELEESSYVNQHIALIRPRIDRIVPRFLAYALHSEMGKSQFKTNEYGGTKQGLNLNDVKSVFVPVPSIEEQERICAELDHGLASCTDAIKNSEREIRLIREYRASLVTRVVMGQLDVREAARNLPLEIKDLTAMPIGEEMNEGLREDQEALEEVA